MKFGYFIAQELHGGRDPATAVREALAEAQTAEAAGFSGVFVSEHHQARLRYLPAPVPLMFLLAAATTTVDVGAALLLMPLAHPVQVAEDLALLDHVSAGRVILGTGMGYLQDDFEAFGLPRAHAPSRLEESLEIVRRLWSEPSVTFYGRRYQLREVSLAVPPRTPGGPPIWVGGRSPAGAKRAARSGDAWVLDSIPRRQTFRPWYEVYLEVCARRGSAPKVAILRDGWLDLGTAADAAYRDAVLDAHRGKAAAGAYAVEPAIADLPPSALRFEQLAEDRWLIGSAAEIHAQLDRWEAELGVGYVLLRLRTRGQPPHAVVLDQLRAFGEVVIRQRQAGAAPAAEPTAWATKGGRAHG
jgi:alkanesulfonate monooxygenase SsuD/methylene tetrahydromethanopterin reductase-like flavin-dependent oxidoreductase (luciferase family)